MRAASRAACCIWRSAGATCRSSLNEREHLTQDLHRRSGPAQRFLLDIEGAQPKIEAYPPLPTTARTWKASDPVDVGQGQGMGPLSLPRRWTLAPMGR